MGNRITNLYCAIYFSREMSNDDQLARKFVERAGQSGIDAFDRVVIDRHNQNPQFLEQQLLDCILDVNGIQIDPEYLSLYIQDMNVASLTDGESSAILFDELLTYSVLSFILTVFSLASDRSQDNFKRCIKNSIVLLDLQGQHHMIGTYNLSDFLEMLMLPSNIVHLAMDAYWTIWTFIIGHELHHLAQSQEATAYQEELDADRYGYHILMQMISAQQQGTIPNELQVFYENMYLSPFMLMEYFRLQDYYCEMCGKELDYSDRPTPETRQQQFLQLFDTEVPDSIDTEEGNALLNTFLDTVEMIRDQITKKMWNGKLDSLLDFSL